MTSSWVVPVMVCSAALASWWGGTMVPVPAADDGARPGWRIDPALASRVELQLLPGIGPVLAQRIIRARERDQASRAGAAMAPEGDARLSWGSVEDLDSILGIGPRTIGKLRPWTTRGARSKPGEFEARH